jgi:hypothetical protein
MTFNRSKPKWRLHPTHGGPDDERQQCVLRRLSRQPRPLRDPVAGTLTPQALTEDRRGRSTLALESLATLARAPRRGPGLPDGGRLRRTPGARAASRADGSAAHGHQVAASNAMTPWAPLGGPNPAPGPFPSKNAYSANLAPRQGRRAEGEAARRRRHRILRLDDERIAVAMSQWAARRCTFAKSSMCQDANRPSGRIA